MLFVHQMHLFRVHTVFMLPGGFPPVNPVPFYFVETESHTAATNPLSTCGGMEMKTNAVQREY